MKNYATLLNELYALVDSNKISDKSKMIQVTGDNAYNHAGLANRTPTSYNFVYTVLSTSYCRSTGFALQTSGSKANVMTISGTTITHSDVSSNVPTSGMILKVIY